MTLYQLSRADILDYQSNLAVGSGIAAAGSFPLNFGVAVYIYRTGTDVHRVMYMVQ